MKKTYFASKVFVFVPNARSGYLGATCFPSEVWQPMSPIHVRPVACDWHTLGGKGPVLFVLIFVRLTKLQENHGYSRAWEVMWKRSRKTPGHSPLISLLALFLETPLFSLCKLNLWELQALDAELPVWPLSRHWELLSLVSQSDIWGECCFTHSPCQDPAWGNHNGLGRMGSTSLASPRREGGVSVVIIQQNRCPMWLRDFLVLHLFK